MPCWLPPHIHYTYMETKQFFDHCVHSGEISNPKQNTLWKTIDGEHCSLNSEQSKSCFGFGQKNMGALRHGALKAFRALWANIETIFVKMPCNWVQLYQNTQKNIERQYWKEWWTHFCSLDENIYKPEACKSKSDGNLRQEKMREFQKSFTGKFYVKFYGKVLRKSFTGKFFGKVLQKVLRGSFTGKFYRKFYGKVLRESVTGKWGARFGLRLGKIAGPPQVQWGSQF